MNVQLSFTAGLLYSHYSVPQAVYPAWFMALTLSLIRFTLTFLGVNTITRAERKYTITHRKRKIMGVGLEPPDTYLTGVSMPVLTEQPHLGHRRALPIRTTPCKNAPGSVMVNTAEGIINNLLLCLMFTILVLYHIFRGYVK